jgi:hypothetical protein
MNYKISKQRHIIRNMYVSRYGAAYGFLQIRLQLEILTRKVVQINSPGEVNVFPI